MFLWIFLEYFVALIPFMIRAAAIVSQTKQYKSTVIQQLISFIHPSFTYTNASNYNPGAHIPKKLLDYPNYFIGK